MASQSELKKRLKVLMSRQENMVCSDCPERQPRWASLIVPPQGSPQGALPIGAFCCLECSGSHRRLGVHISFVRSINLDSWKEREVQAMENGGNKKVNSIYEARLHAPKPVAGADGPTRERFIRDKYERRKYFDGSILARYYQGGMSEEESDSDEAEPTARQSRRQPKAGVQGRSPSEAARKRAEARKARLTGVSTSNNAGANHKVAASPRRHTAPPKAPEVDLLDFGSMPTTEQGKNPPAPPSNSSSPTLDLFADLSVSRQNGGSNAPANPAAVQAVNNAANAAASTMNKPSQPKKMSSDEILAMFNTPSQQQGFPMASNGGMMMPTNNNMMGGMNPQQMQSNFMYMQQQNGNMGMQGNGAANNNPNMALQQQQQMMMMQQAQQQQMAAQRPVAINMQGFPVPVAAGAPSNTNQQMGMMNQFQMGNSATMMPMGGQPSAQVTHNRPGQTSAQQPQQNNNQDAFGQFGMNAFRS
uniref:Arf-GAP domain-containing protein n=1 Tax=Attheya septentrionalis TaxID=420275 RepID=A0A6T7J753_9STRA|mmetsp:Transcript_29005/g.53066  ORF Transcript_29005/g.53066 Transcript_29005/m.53066 type:complete len:474 (+) Transcript_29005:456-1877(+)